MMIGISIGITAVKSGGGIPASAIRWDDALALFWDDSSYVEWDS